VSSSRTCGPSARAARRLAAIGGNQHLVAGEGQRTFQDAADVRIVVHDQHRFAARLDRPRLRHERLRRAGRQRQVDRKRRAGAGRAAHDDVAAALLHDAVRHRQPQAGAAARPWS
jgi:hypothetical protein